MGVYVNPGNRAFRESVEKEIYVDKSLLIEKVWKHAKKMNKYICISRPRRFGKSTDVSMLTAYYSKGCDSSALFDNLNIAKQQGYNEHLNNHNVIYLDIQSFLSETNSIIQMIERINEKVIRECAKIYSDYCEDKSLSSVLNEICANTDETFIFIIDDERVIIRTKLEKPSKIKGLALI